MSETPQQQIDRLARFIMAEVPGEPSESEGAVTSAIRIITVALDLPAEATGARRIAEERQRQIEEEGWAPEHDDSHFPGCLAAAGAAYALEMASRASESGGWQEAYIKAARVAWPFDSEWWKPTGDPARNLTKAGALIAAEIDRLLRADTTGDDNA